VSETRCDRCWVEHPPNTRLCALRQLEFRVDATIRALPWYLRAVLGLMRWWQRLVGLFR
jgi:hypothetical protein